MTRACGTLPAGMPIFAAMPSASGSLSPVPGSMNTLWIFSGVLAATSSMSMPPSLEAMSATRCVPRSTTMPTYSSFLMSAPSSTRSRRTFCPSGPVWCVFSIMPRILPAHSRTSLSDFVTFTPPPLPRPPAWICALTTHTLPPSSRAALTASSTEKQGMPRGVATPYLRRISFAWYSWIFILRVLDGSRNHRRLPRARSLTRVKEMPRQLDEAGARGAAGHVFRRRGEIPLEAAHVGHADGFLEEGEHRSVVRRVSDENTSRVGAIEIQAEPLGEEQAAGRELVVAAEPAVGVD